MRALFQLQSRSFNRDFFECWPLAASRCLERLEHLLSHNNRLARRCISLATLELNMKLYGFPPSPNTRKVQAVAAHLDIPLELEFVNLAKVKRERRSFS